MKSSNSSGSCSFRSVGCKSMFSHHCRKISHFRKVRIDNAVLVKILLLFLAAKFVTFLPGFSIDFRSPERCAEIGQI